MEVKEAIEFIERYRYAKNSKTDEIVDLLKFLEAENKAYEGMWEELKKGYSRDGVYFYHDCSDNNDEYVNDVIRELEKKYQQKHYPEVGNEI